MFSGLCGTLESVNLAVDGLVCFQYFKKYKGVGTCVENAYLGETHLQLDREIWYFFLNGWEIVKLWLDGENFSAWGSSHEIPCYLEITTKVICWES